MNPLTHLLASWIVAAHTTDNLRDRRLVTLAGVVPDLDGLGIVVDCAKGALTTGNFHYYQEYHHLLMHGLPAAVVCSILMAVVARQRWRVLGLTFLTFHFHLLCDLAGSRGPGRADLWPICYFEPLHRLPVWFWRHQWRLDGWENRVITLALLAWALWLAVKKGDSVVGVFNRRCDEVFVGALRKWFVRLHPPVPS